MCTEVDQYNLQTVHHEMGHVIYYMLYAHLPLVFRAGANSGFHEAVGDTISLSVETIRHQAELGLVKSNVQSKGTWEDAFLKFELHLLRNLRRTECGIEHGLTEQLIHKALDTLA